MTEVLDVARSYSQQGSIAIQPESSNVQGSHRDVQESSWHMQQVIPDEPSEGLFPHVETGQDPSAMFASITDWDTLLDFTQFMGDFPTESFTFSNDD